MRPSHIQTNVIIGQCSEAGRKPVNQDFYGALIPEGRVRDLKGIAIAIADGISSSQVSGIAAETAVKSFLTDYYCTSETWSVKNSGQRVIAAANSWLHARTRNSNLHENMDRGHVCAFSALVLKGRTAHIFHVGDTRVWRLCNGTLEPLTTDHRTYLSATDSYLTRALGLMPELEISYGEVDMRTGDVFAVTSDGVHDHVTPGELAELIAGNDDLDIAARSAVEMALENGSDDNLTIQIARIGQLADSDPAGIVNTLPPAQPMHVPSCHEGYRIVRQLHASSRSHIYIAIDGETDQKVALKVPSVDLRDDRDYLARFAMEEWIARRINSPHVLKAIPPCGERKTLFVVMELIEGQTLRQWMSDNPKPNPETVRSIVEQIAKGLRAFHRMEMLHQDLRPENIMIDSNGTVKIIDFGAVKVAGVVETIPHFDTGNVLGTHQYAAPEYFIGEPGTHLSDLYSLAVIAYEMLTGRLPYGAQMARCNTAMKQSRIKYTPLATFRTDLPLWIDGALRKAVHFDPLKRQKALSEFTFDLRHARPGLMASVSPPLMERNPVLFWKSMAAVLAAICIALVYWR